MLLSIYVLKDVDASVILRLSLIVTVMSTRETDDVQFVPVFSQDTLLSL